MTPPRPYNNQVRHQQQEALRQRIVEAAAHLHARQGGLATTYADVAKQAGVSLPTVHKHFPSADDLFVSCTRHIAELGPVVRAQQILGAIDLAQAAETLVASLDEINAYFEPWLVWREHEHIQVLADITLHQQQELTALCDAVLDRHGVAGDRRELAALWESLLNFELWHRLVRAHKLTRAHVRRLLVQLLLGAAGPRPAAPHPKGPTARSSRP
jgi:AcrR family transcriptional regulator